MFAAVAAVAVVTRGSRGRPRHRLAALCVTGSRRPRQSRQSPRVTRVTGSRQFASPASPASVVAVVRVTDAAAMSVTRARVDCVRKTRRCTFEAFQNRKNFDFAMVSHNWPAVSSIDDYRKPLFLFFHYYSSDSYHSACPQLRTGHSERQQNRPLRSAPVHLLPLSFPLSSGCLRSNSGVTVRGQTVALSGRIYTDEEFASLLKKTYTSKRNTLQSCGEPTGDKTARVQSGCRSPRIQFGLAATRTSRRIRSTKFQPSLRQQRMPVPCLKMHRIPGNRPMN